MKAALDAVARVAGLKTTPKSAALEERLGKLRSGLQRLEDENVRTATACAAALAAVALEVAEEVVGGPAERELRDLRLAREALAARMDATKGAIAKAEVELATAQKEEREEQEEADLRRLCDAYSATSLEAVELVARALVAMAKARTIEARWLPAVDRWFQAGGAVPETKGLSVRNVIRKATERACAMEPGLRTDNPKGIEVTVTVGDFAETAVT